jgi:signal transduction histidine kinase
MLWLDPGAAFTAAVFTALELGLLARIAWRHRDRFYLWGFLALGVRLAYFLAQLGPLLAPGSALNAALWTLVAALASGVGALAFLASGLTYRNADALRPRAVRLAAVAVAALAALYVVPGLPPRWVGLPLGLVEVTALAGAGLAFWPVRSRRSIFAGVLSVTLLVWALVRLTFHFPLDPVVRGQLGLGAGILQGLLALGLAVVVIDRAERRALFEGEVRQTLLDSMDLGLALVGPDLRVSRVNRWMTERFGPGIPGQTCVTAYLAGPLQCPTCPWRTGAPARHQVAVAGRGGRSLLLTCSPVASPHGPPVLLEVIQDVTEQEALRERLHTVEHLAAIGKVRGRIAHEIRNPLGTLVVHAALAEQAGERGQPDAVRQHLDTVRRHGATIAGLVEEYLRGVPRPRRDQLVDLHLVLAGRLDALADELTHLGITLRRAWAPALPCVWGDPDQLGEALGNLCRNAIEAMPGGGTLTVRATAAGGRVEVDVLDTGPGVPQADLERIFRVLYTTKLHGAGFGLALAREVAKEHHGTLVCLRSTGGAHFRLSLPAHPEVTR